MMRPVATPGTRRIACTAAVLVVALLTAPASGANHYVRQGADGADDGSDWADAWTELPEALVRGDTYYVADGEYPGPRLDDPADGERTITIAKATPGDHGADTGWQDAYGDGQAVFTSQITVEAGRYLIDGRVRGDDWASGYGFKIDASAGKGVYIGSSSTDADDLTVRFVEIAGRGRDGLGSPANDLVYVLAPVTGLRFERCYLHDAGRTAWLLRNADDGLIEHCRVSRNESTAEQHSEAISASGTDRWTVRYNLWEDIEGTGIIVFVGDAWLLTGNVCFETGTPPYGGTSNGAFCTWTGEAVTNTRVHNNTFVACTGLNQGVYFDAAHAAGNQAYNNLWYDCERVGIGGADGDYNMWTRTPVRYGTTPQAHDVVLPDGDDPFVDLPSGDFRLAGPTPAGIALPEPFQHDPRGVRRGADGTWDRGAFEYVAGGIVADGWRIVARHGEADVETPAADGYVEPRAQGIRRLRIVFAEALDPATVSAETVTIAGDAAGDQSASIASVALDGDRTIAVTLTDPLPDADRYTVAVADTLRLASGEAPGGDLDLRLAALAGDADGSGEVTPADAAAVRQHAGEPVTPATARYDLDGSGNTSGTDMKLATRRAGNALP